MPRSIRYTLILVLFTLGTGLAAVAGWRYARTSSPVNGPIVLITIDSLRADRLPAFGYTKVPTPAIDALAADGLVFEHAYAHAPQTLPAHVSLLTGRLPFETGVRDDVGFVVPESDRLLAQMLADRGYATGGIVSSFVLRRETGLARGFTFFDDDLGGERQADGRPIVSRDGAESEKRAERWLSEVGTSRAFLFLHLDEPRAPYAPPDRFADYDPYDGEVAYVDELVGRLVSYLKKQQLYEQATIILVGDHGESLGAHGEREHGLLVSDETIRVPLIIKQAGSEGAGRRVADLVQHVDLVPTVLDLARAPTPDGLAGRSLRPVLEGGSLPERVAYAESLFARYQYGWSPLLTVTDGRVRYISGAGARRIFWRGLGRFRGRRDRESGQLRGQRQRDSGSRTRVEVLLKTRRRRCRHWSPNGLDPKNASGSSRSVPWARVQPRSAARWTSPSIRHRRPGSSNRTRPRRLPSPHANGARRSTNSGCSPAITPPCSICGRRWHRWRREPNVTKSPRMRIVACSPPIPASRRAPWALVDAFTFAPTRRCPGPG